MNSNPNPDSPVVEYEMGYGADEFGKVLMGPFSGGRSDFNCVATGLHRWLVTLAGSSLELVIEATQAPPREIALFRLPVLKVRFQFDRADAGAREKFFHRFHQYFHKGGG
jgi:hypothetical protein